MTRTEQWQIVRRVLLVFVPIGSAIGAGLGFILGGGTLRSMAAGAVIGLLVAGGVIFFDVSWAVSLVPRGWREAPFLVVLVTRSITWLAIIVLGISFPLVAVGGTSLGELFDARFMTSVGISFVAALVFNFVAQVSRLLGRGVLIGLVVGRYHRPREEIRVFLFVDLRGSTPIAEQLGSLRYHAFLKRFVADVSDAAFRQGAEIHRTVGDGIVLTWTEARGLRDAACVMAVLDIQQQLDRTAPEYTTEFGVAPRIWAGMHIGPVVTGEIGTVKHEIVYLGDTPNVAARIEQACRTFDRPFLVSVDLLERVEVPTDVDVESLGPVDLRGVGEPLELIAVERSHERIRP